MIIDPNRDPEAINIHLRGLKNIIDMRGGFDGLPIFLVQIACLSVCLIVPVRRATADKVHQ